MQLPAYLQRLDHRRRGLDLSVYRLFLIAVAALITAVLVLDA